MQRNDLLRKSEIIEIFLLGLTGSIVAVIGSIYNNNLTWAAGMFMIIFCPIGTFLLVRERKHEKSLA